MKNLLLVSVCVLIAVAAFAQAPQKMSYQAVVRDASNLLVSNVTIGMQVSILQGSTSGSSVYTETQQPLSNDNGLVSIEIGTGTLVSGDFTTIDWSNGPYFIETKVDLAGGVNYTITATSELISVPYALYSKRSETTDCSSCDVHFVNAGSSDVMNGSLTVDDIQYNAPRVHTLLIGDISFVARSENATVHRGTGMGGVYIANGAVYGLVAPVNIPVNATVTEVEIYFTDSDASNDLKFYFYAHQPNGGYYSQGTITSSGSAGYSTLTMSGLSITVWENSNYEFHVFPVNSVGTSVAWPGTSLVVHGAKFTYQINEAQ